MQQDDKKVSLWQKGIVWTGFFCYNGNNSNGSYGGRCTVLLQAPAGRQEMGLCWEMGFMLKESKKISDYLDIGFLQMLQDNCSKAMGQTNVKIIRYFF